MMGTSVGMIEAHDGALIDTAHDGLLARLEEIASEGFRHKIGTACVRIARKRLGMEAGDGTRTHDLRLGKPTLYQLSYTRARSRLASLLLACG